MGQGVVGNEGEITDVIKSIKSIYSSFFFFYNTSVFKPMDLQRTGSRRILKLEFTTKGLKILTIIKKSCPFF